MSTALVVRTPAAKVVGWLCIVGASLMGIGWSAAADAALTADVGMYLVVLAFFSLGVACVVLSGSVEMDSQLIRYTTPWARYAMRWDEVAAIEAAPWADSATRWDEVEAIQPDPDARRRALGTSALVFHGGDKRLSVLGPSYWRGPDSQEVLRLLQAQIEQRGIEVRTARAALWAFPRNTKQPR